MKNKVDSRKDIRKQAGFGIRGQLVIGFTLFVLIVLIIVWIFQVLLLNFFYEQTKMSDLHSVQEGIDHAIAEGELDVACNELAVKYDVCIAVYGVNNGAIGDLLISTEVSPTCIIHYTDSQALNSYYEKALASGGEYTQRFTLAARENNIPSRSDSHKDKPRPEHKDEEHTNNVNNDNVFVIAVSVKALSDSLGNDYAAFINLRFTPVNAVQHTRSVQYGYIAMVVIIAAVIFSFFFSTKIARPLERMTLAAERMANGDFSTHFKIEGYRETRRLAQTLNYAVEEISQADKLQRELIANVSHDLRTPLTLISGYAEMMRDIPGENNPENNQIIIDETKRLTTLVNDMLDFSKYNSGFEEPVFHSFNLTESVRSIINRYSELVRQNGYRFIFTAEDEVTVTADERMILQVIYNLINNAVNYTGDDKTVIIEQTVCGDGTVKIAITDTGNGIPEEAITQIWNRYYKVDKSHKRAVTGSGLGLSIVSRLLQLHSAEYGVESSANAGSCFWFKLKISQM